MARVTIVLPEDAPPRACPSDDGYLFLRYCRPKRAEVDARGAHEDVGG